MNAATKNKPPVLESEGGEKYLNISTYKFVSLDRLEQRRAELLELCQSLGLMGTILLSHEGINMFLSGPPDKIQAFFDSLHQDPLLSDIVPKESYSDAIPFRRMLVRLKKEIISFGVESVAPEIKTSPKLKPQELRRWLDEGRPIRLLDTRNDYEVDLGTFEGAEHLDIKSFRDFPEAIKKLPEEAKRQPLVMFCTGGIRCEKAGPLLEQAGFEEVYQLDGGILKYFEECGGAHYDGDCFVFDGRVALDCNLQPTGDLLCFVCQAVLTPEDVESDKFELGKHCPRCWVDPQILAERQHAERQQKILAYSRSQPGCTPYDNFREIHVPGKLAGSNMLNFLCDYQPNIDRSQWQHWLSQGHITFNENPVAEDLIVREGQRFVQHEPNTTEPAVNPEIELLFEDNSLVVVSKPAPMPTHPSGRYNRNTLQHILSHVYPHDRLRPAHRLDANTSGILVLCRKQQVSRVIQPQFSEQTVLKHYLACVHGSPSWEQLRCEAPLSSDPGPAGGRTVHELGQPARTDFQVLKRFEDGTALVLANPRTGRTNQIRVHLQHLGHAILGDPLYLPDGTIGRTQTLNIADSPMCLHAWKLALLHPNGQRVEFEAKPPAWAQL